MNSFNGAKIKLLELLLCCNDNQLELSMKIRTNEDIFEICFHNVSRFCVQNLSTPMEIHGFQIICNKQMGWDKDSSFVVRDYEDNRFSFFCEDYSVHENNEKGCG